ncbi:MAG: hypothetical protein ACOYNZ_12810 [Rhodoferax sp.]
MNALTLDQALAVPAGDPAEQSSDALFKLKNDAADRLTNAKTVVDHIERALDLKYSERARRLRSEVGKDTGVVHFDDGDVRITADLPKKVEWDQKQLANISSRISAGGENPAQYLEISYRVSETKFGAWPESLKNSFVAARTVKTGKPDFRLALINPTPRSL